MKNFDRNFSVYQINTWHLWNYHGLAPYEIVLY